MECKSQVQLNNKKTFFPNNPRQNNFLFSYKLSYIKSLISCIQLYIPVLRKWSYRNIYSQNKKYIWIHESAYMLPKATATSKIIIRYTFIQTGSPLVLMWKKETIC